MKEIQLDVLDVQARASLPDMIKCVELSGAEGSDYEAAIRIF